MSTMQQQTPPAAALAGQDMGAVEVQMGKIVIELGQLWACCLPPSAPAAGYGQGSPGPAR